MTDVVAQLHGLRPAAGLEATIAAWSDQLRLPVQLLHPGTTDPDLAGWLHVVVPAGRDPDDVVRTLLADTTVAAAYVKPPDAAP